MGLPPPPPSVSLSLQHLLSSAVTMEPPSTTMAHCSPSVIVLHLPTLSRRQKKTGQSYKFLSSFAQATCGQRGKKDRPPHAWSRPQRIAERRSLTMHGVHDHAWSIFFLPLTTRGHTSIRRKRKINHVWPQDLGTKICGHAWPIGHPNVFSKLSTRGLSSFPRVAFSKCSTHGLAFRPRSMLASLPTTHPPSHRSSVIGHRSSAIGARSSLYEPSTPSAIGHPPYRSARTGNNGGSLWI